jgi:hypothetical protein
MLNLLIDTCVWLDIAKDPEQQKTLRVIDELIDMEEVRLLLPETVITEFNNNKDRIIKESNQSLSSVIKRVKVMVEKLGANETKKLVLGQLDDVNYKIPNLGHTSLNIIDNIERLFKKATILAATDSIKLKALDRAINKHAPFHRNKNSFNDAILMETYGACVRENNTGSHYAFVTHNTSDFSQPNGNQKDPHPDFELYFNPGSSTYFINLAESLRKVSPELVSELMIDQEDWEEPVREFSEILAEENKLFDIIWYHRYKMRVYRITNEVNATPGIKNKSLEIKKLVSEGALKGAKRVEKKYGKKNLGPWDDFELGMLHGKLSALRWVLGDDWDFLDT